MAIETTRGEQYLVLLQNVMKLKSTVASRTHFRDETQKLLDESQEDLNSALADLNAFLATNPISKSSDFDAECNAPLPIVTADTP